MIAFRGEVLEWTIRLAWRASVAYGDRGFESHPLRQGERFRSNCRDRPSGLSLRLDKGGIYFYLSVQYNGYFRNQSLRGN